MAEIEQLSFSYQEVVTALLRERGIHDGVWQLVFSFGIGAANAGESAESLMPVAIVPIKSIGIARVEAESNLTVNAAIANPAQVSQKKQKREGSKESR